MDIITYYHILTIRNDKKISKRDMVINEIPLTIFLNNDELITLICTPRHIKELTCGFLYSEGYIKDKDDILSINFDETENRIDVLSKLSIDPLEGMRRSRFITPDCTNPSAYNQLSDEILYKKLDTDLTIKAERIFELLAELKNYTKLYKTTGATHNAALYSKGKILFLNEDISRHNTIDKALGWAILNGIKLNHALIITSGRATSTIIGKVIKGGIPIIISRSAATSSAVILAKRYGITLVGFARGKRINIYSNEDRIAV